MMKTVVRTTLPAIDMAIITMLIALLSFNYGLFKPHKEIFAGNEEEEMESKGKSNESSMLQAMYQQWEDMQKDPATGTIPIERLNTAWNYTRDAQRAQETGRTNAGLTIDWISRGPNNIGGRTRSILVSPNDVTGNTVFAGSVSGGLWKSTNMKSASPTWTSVNDFMQNLAISTLAYSPNNTNIFYAGTGEGFNNTDAARGLGIAKSTDGGNTWSFLASTQNSNFYFVYKLVVKSNGDVYAVTRTGVWASTDAGTTWTNVLTGLYGDIEVASNGTLYAATNNSSGPNGPGVYQSATGASGSWTNLNSLGIGLASTSLQRIEVATAPNSASTVYIMQYEDSAYLGGNNKVVVYRSTNGGTSFQRVGRPVDADVNIANPDFTRAQGWYNFILKVDPANSQTLYAGGIDIFKSTNGGNTWTQLTHWFGGYGFQTVHSDQHAIEFEASNSNVIYFGNDGGVYQSTNGTAATPTLTIRNSDYNVTQFYSCAAHPTAGSNEFLAGSQDNGTQRFTNPGYSNSTPAVGGDGGFCSIDQNTPAYQFTAYTYNNYYRSIDAGNSFSSVANSYAGTGRFINPTDYDNTSKALYASSSSGTFLKWTNAISSSTFTQVTVSALGTQQASAVTISKAVANRLYLGTASGQVVTVDNANTASGTVAGKSLGTPVATYLNCIWEDPANANHLVIVYSNYGVNNVWETNNATAATPTWTAKDGNLPDMPIYWVLPDPNNTTNNVLVATELGVYSTDNFSAAGPVWAPGNTGMANCRVTQLRLRNSDKMVVASTHGRGLFTSDIFMNPTADFTSNKLLTYTSVAIQFTDLSAQSTSWQWDFNGDGTWDNTSQNPLYTYTTPGIYNVKLRINGNASLEKTRVLKILPERGTPYTEAMGGNFETNQNDFAGDYIGNSYFSLGNSTQAGKDGTRSGSYAWVLDIDNPSYNDNSTSYLYSPSFNCTATGNYTVSFYAKYNVENSYDGFRVEFTTDKGASWTQLANTVASNWYDFNNPYTDRPFPQNQAFFTLYNQTSYMLCSFTTAAFGGNNSVGFRIVFKSDITGSGAGVAIDDFSLTGQVNSGLPVKLISFTGYNSGNNNILQWKTTNETNNSRYEVERSLDGQGFSKIGTVTSQNNLLGATYQYTDDITRVAFKTFYYRLKMVDFDGRFAYSPVVVLRLPNRKESITTIGNYSPGSVKVLVPADLLTNEPVKASIIAQNGAVLERLILNSTQNNIDIQRLPAGMYYLQFTSKQQVIQTDKFIKQ